MVLLDFSMPRLNGFEAFQKIDQIKPGVPVVMASGLARTSEVDDLINSGRVKFLSKPFHEQELITAFNSLLSKGN